MELCNDHGRFVISRGHMMVVMMMMMMILMIPVVNDPLPQRILSSYIRNTDLNHNINY